MRLLLCAALASGFVGLGPTAPGEAQERSRLQAGARVRLWLPELGEAPPVIGQLLLLEPDTITVVPVGKVVPVRVALEHVRRMEVNTGQPRALRIGGILFGTAMGAWVGASALDEDPRCDAAGDEDPDCRWETAPVLVGAGGGAVIAAVGLGLLLPDVWREVSLLELRGAVTSAARRGIELRFSIRP